MSDSGEMIVAKEFAVGAVKDDDECRAPNGTPWFDDARIGRMLAREPVLARFILRALPVLRAAEAWRELWRRNVRDVERRSPDVMYVRFPEEATVLAEAVDAFKKAGE